MAPNSPLPSTPASPNPEAVYARTECGVGFFDQIDPKFELDLAIHAINAMKDFNREMYNSRFIQHVQRHIIRAKLGLEKRP